MEKRKGEEMIFEIVMGSFIFLVVITIIVLWRISLSKQGIIYKICNNCGYENDDNLFCLNCGEWKNNSIEAKK